MSDTVPSSFYLRVCVCACVFPTDLVSVIDGVESIELARQK